MGQFNQTQVGLLDFFPLVLDSTFSKRKRFKSSLDSSMEADKAKAELAALTEELGREIRVFPTVTTPTSDKAPSNLTSQDEESEDFYAFTPEDYYRLLGSKKEEKFLKTRKIREAEEAERRSRITKAVIRVRFPDNYTLEAKFHPSDTVQSLMDLLMKVIARPDLPFYIYTTPPKKQIKDLSKDFYSLGFAPGAIVYFSYNLPKEGDEGVADVGHCLRDDIIALNSLEVIPEQAEVLQAAPEPAVKEPSLDTQEPKPVKKPAKPKWFKM
ncbi:hypothetical protein AAC387_Pa02g0272 [Persea americana]